MVANAASAEVEVTLGGRARTLRYGIGEIALLEQALGRDVLAFAMGGGGDVTFVSQAILCGLSRTQKGVTLPQVFDWLEKFDGELEDLKWKIMLAYANGRPGSEGRELAKKLAQQKAKAEAVRAGMAEEDNGESAVPLPGGESLPTWNTGKASSSLT